MFRSCDAPGQVLATNQPPLMVACMAIAEIGVVVEDAGTQTTHPLIAAIVWNVAPQKVVAMGKVDRPIHPNHALGDLLQACVGLDQRQEASVVDDNVILHFNSLRSACFGEDKMQPLQKER